MAIKASCSSCSTSFNAKDSLAGRRVKCPKCGDKITIPGVRSDSPGAKKSSKGAKSTKSSSASKNSAAAKKRRVNPAAGTFNVMDDLLNEANVKTKSKGAVCDDCGAELELGAMICIECGFNLETGSKLRTDAFDDDTGENDYGTTSAEKMLRQAEKDIEDMPVTGDDQDFGDGAESLVIAGVAGIILVALMASALIIIFMMEKLSDQVHSSFISMIASSLLAIGCIVWISIVAFLVDKTQGIICVATAGLYCVVFGFMSGKQLLLPTIVLIIALLIAGASGYYYAYYAPDPSKLALLEMLNGLSYPLTQVYAVLVGSRS